MKKIYLLLVLVSLSAMVFAQDKEIISADTKKEIYDNIDKRQYLFSEFTDGRVIFKDLKISEGKLNYNTILGDLQFISGEKIMSLSNQENVLRATIGEHTLVKLKKGFAEVITQTQNGAMLLTVKTVVTAKDANTSIGYGAHSETAGNSKASSISTEETANVKLPIEVQIETKLEYYLLKNTKIETANKKGFTKMFADHKKDVEQYIDDNKIKFSDEEQLKQLFNYCISLK